MKIKELDLRGLACPQPVIRTRNALREGNFSRLELLVDNDAARANVTRFAEHSGYQLLDTIQEGNEYRLTIAAGEAIDPADEERAYQSAQAAERNGKLLSERGAGKTVFISTDTLGKGDEELGHILMRAFFYALTELEGKPKRIILMNRGVKLATEGSQEAEDLKKLEEEGVEIVACGTCLDYYHLKERLEVGSISNMYDIAAFLLEGESLSL